MDRRSHRSPSTASFRTSRQARLNPCSPPPGGRSSPCVSDDCSKSPAAPWGEVLRKRILDMSNPEYQRLLRCSAAELRERLPGTGDGRQAISDLIAAVEDSTLLKAKKPRRTDIGALREAYAQIDDTKPTVIIAYTVKGHGLPMEGHPQNHSALLSAEEYLRDLATRITENADAPCLFRCRQRCGTPLCRNGCRHCTVWWSRRRHRQLSPTDFGRTPSGTATTQRPWDVPSLT